MSHTSAIFHIVLSTSERRPSIAAAHAPVLYAYIIGVARNMRCKVLGIGGVEDHVHLLVDLHPDVALSYFVKEVKRTSSLWMREKIDYFPRHNGWGRGYFAASVSFSHRDAVLQYIASQAEHHKDVDAAVEFRVLMEKNGFFRY